MSDFKLNPSKKINNNGATVVNGGNIDPKNPISKNLDLSTLGVNRQGFGSEVKEITPVDDGKSNPNGITSAITGGAHVFAYSPAKFGDRTVLARGVGNDAGAKINRVASTFLNRTAAEYASVKRFEKNDMQGSKIVDGDKWLMPPPPSGGTEIYPGFVPNPLRGSGYSFENGKGGTAADKNITANRSVPGEITFRTGSPKPTTRNLKARDSGEGNGP